ncbi:MAG: hypothetical protein ACON4T_09485 [Synechococcus sp.]
MALNDSMTAALATSVSAASFSHLIASVVVWLQQAIQSIFHLSAFQNAAWVVINERQFVLEWQHLWVMRTAVSQLRLRAPCVMPLALWCGADARNLLVGNEMH